MSELDDITLRLKKRLTPASRITSMYQGQGHMAQGQGQGHQDTSHENPTSTEQRNENDVSVYTQSLRNAQQLLENLQLANTPSQSAEQTYESRPYGETLNTDPNLGMYGTDPKSTYDTMPNTDPQVETYATDPRSTYDTRILNTDPHLGTYATDPKSTYGTAPNTDPNFSTFATDPKTFDTEPRTFDSDPKSARSQGSHDADRTHHKQVQFRNGELNNYRSSEEGAEEEEGGEDYNDGRQYIEEPQYEEEDTYEHEWQKAIPDHHISDADDDMVLPRPLNDVSSANFNNYIGTTSATLSQLQEQDSWMTHDNSQLDSELQTRTLADTEFGDTRPESMEFGTQTLDTEFGSEARSDRTGLHTGEFGTGTGIPDMEFGGTGSGIPDTEFGATGQSIPQSGGSEFLGYDSKDLDGLAVDQRIDFEATNDMYAADEEEDEK